MGTPSVFLRLSNCNLTCGGIHTVSSKTLDHNATWRCDTIETWIHGQHVDSQALLLEWETFGWVDAFSKGDHLVITGGEPLLQQDLLVDFLNLLQDRVGSYLSSDPVVTHSSVFIEVETNGTICPDQAFHSHVRQYNVSPKLSNSGMPLRRRQIPDVIKWFNTLENAIFKFVISTPEDVTECLEEWVQVFSLDKAKVWFMPAADTAEALTRLGPLVRKWAGECGVGYSHRLQVERGWR